MMNKANTRKKLKFTFEELEQEMSILTPSGQRALLGGSGENDPVIVYGYYTSTYNWVDYSTWLSMWNSYFGDPAYANNNGSGFIDYFNNTYQGSWENPNPPVDPALSAYNARFNLPANTTVSSDANNPPAGYTIVNGILKDSNGNSFNAVTQLLSNGTIKIFVAPSVLTGDEILLTGTLLHESIHAWNYYENATDMLLDPLYAQYVMTNSEYNAYDAEATFYQNNSKYAYATNALNERDSYTSDPNYDPNSGLSSDPHWKPL